MPSDSPFNWRYYLPFLLDFCDLFDLLDLVDLADSALFGFFALALPLPFVVFDLEFGLDLMALASFEDDFFDSEVLDD